MVTGRTEGTKYDSYIPVLGTRWVVADLLFGTHMTENRTPPGETPLKHTK